MRYARVLRAAWAPVLTGVAVLALLGTVIVLSQSVGGDDTPSPAPPFQPPAGTTVAAADIKTVDGSRLVIVRQTRSGTEEQEIVTAPGTRVEQLAAIAPSDVAPGDWLTVVGVPNDVKNFAVYALVVIAGSPAAGADGVARSPAGFAGHEPSRDPRARPIIGGRVLAVEGNVITIEGPTGDIRVTAGPEAAARLYRIEPATVADMVEGDRLAGDFDSGPGSPLLLLPVSGAQEASP